MKATLDTSDVSGGVNAILAQMERLKGAGGGGSAVDVSAYMAQLNSAMANMTTPGVTVTPTVDGDAMRTSVAAAMANLDAGTMKLPVGIDPSDIREALASALASAGLSAVTIPVQFDTTGATTGPTLTGSNAISPPSDVPASLVTPAQIPAAATTTVPPVLPAVAATEAGAQPMIPGLAPVPQVAPLPAQRTAEAPDVQGPVPPVVVPQVGTGTLPATGQVGEAGPVVPPVVLPTPSPEPTPTGVPNPPPVVPGGVGPNGDPSTNETALLRNEIASLAQAVQTLAGKTGTGGGAPSGTPTSTPADTSSEPNTVVPPERDPAAIREQQRLAREARQYAEIRGQFGSVKGDPAFDRQAFGEFDTQVGKRVRAEGISETQGAKEIARQWQGEMAAAGYEQPAGPPMADGSFSPPPPPSPNPTPPPPSPNPTPPPPSPNPTPPPPSPNPTPPPPPTPSPVPPTGLRRSGLGRLVSGVYLANEVERIADTEAEYGNASDLAGANPEQQFQASAREIHSLEGGIFGTVAGNIMDPGGFRLRGDEDTVRGAADSDRRDDDIRSGVMHARDLAVATETAQADSTPEKRKAEQDARDLDRDQQLKAEQDRYRKTQQDAAKARDDAVAAANQHRNAARAEGVAATYVAGVLAPPLAIIAAPAALDYAHIQSSKADSDIADAEATYRATTGVAERQMAAAEAEVRAKYDAEQRKIRAGDVAADQVFGLGQEAQRDELAGDTVAAQVARKQAEVTAEAERLRKDRGQPAADKYLAEIGNPSVVMTENVAGVEHDNAIAATNQQASDLAAHVRAVEQRQAGQTDESVMTETRQRNADRVADAQRRLDAVGTKYAAGSPEVAAAQAVMEQTRLDANTSNEDKRQELARNRDLEHGQISIATGDEQVQAQAAATAALGGLYEADSAKFRREQDDKLQALRDRLAHETDAQKRTDLGKLITATETGNATEAQARENAHGRQIELEGRGQDARIAEDERLAAGDSAGAAKVRREYQLGEQIDRVVSDTDLSDPAALGPMAVRIARAAQVSDADQKADDAQRNRQSAQGLEGAESNVLRAYDRGGEADVLDLRQQIHDSEEAAGKDPNRFAAAKTAGDLNLAALQRRMTPKTEFGFTNESYWTMLQQNAVIGEDASRAMDAARNATWDNSQVTPGHALAVGGPKSWGDMQDFHLGPEATAQMGRLQQMSNGQQGDAKPGADASPRQMGGAELKEAADALKTVAEMFARVFANESLV